MIVMRRRREEEAVFEQPCNFPYGARHLAFDGPGSPGRGRRVVGLIQDKHRARSERRENVAQISHVGLVGENAVRNDESRADAPRVGGKAAGAPRLKQVFTEGFDTLDLKEAKAMLDELV
jgi:hypothetical protein